MENRLRELAEEGWQGQDIAAKLSAEFGEYFSPDSVFHKASRLGISLQGRAGTLEPASSQDPFGPPSWLSRELEKLEEPERKRPFRAIMVPLEGEADPTQIEAAYHELWGEYVSDIVRQGRATEEQGEQAVKNIPSWFHRWARVPMIKCFDPDLSKQNEESLNNSGSCAVPQSYPTSQNGEPKSESGSADDVSPSSSVASSSDLKARSRGFTAISPSVGPAENGNMIRKSLVKRCERCGGNPHFDSSLDEWVCQSCGHILRFSQSQR